MTKYTETKFNLLNDMYYHLREVDNVVKALDAVDRLEDMDLHDQLTTMYKLLADFNAVNARAFSVLPSK